MRQSIYPVAENRPVYQAPPLSIGAASGIFVLYLVSGDRNRIMHIHLPVPGLLYSYYRIWFGECNLLPRGKPTLIIRFQGCILFTLQEFFLWTW